MLALVASRTLTASRQAVGESLQMSNTPGSAYPRTTIRADDFVSTRFSVVLLPSFLSTRTNRDCIYTILQTLFPQYSPDDFGFRWRYYRCCCVILPCIPLTENVSKISSFSRPFKPCHCFSLDRAAFARNALCNNSDTLTRALFHFDSTPSSGSTDGGRSFDLRRR